MMFTVNLPLGIGLPLGKWSNLTSLFFNLVETNNQIMIVHFQGLGTTSPHRRTTNRLVLHAFFNSFNIPASCLVKQCEIWSISILTVTTGKCPWSVMPEEGSHVPLMLKEPHFPNPLEMFMFLSLKSNVHTSSCPNYFTSSDPHHDMLGGGCQVGVVI